MTRPVWYVSVIAGQDRRARSALLLPGRLGAMARIGTFRKPQPEPTSFPKPCNHQQRIAHHAGLCAGRAGAADRRRGGPVLRARHRLVALEGAGCCGACRITWAANTTREAGPNRRSRLTKQGRYDGVLITATGCSAQLKDYAHQFAGRSGVGTARRQNSPPRPVTLPNFAPPLTVTPAAAAARRLSSRPVP